MPRHKDVVEHVDAVPVAYLGAPFGDRVIPPINLGISAEGRFSCWIGQDALILQVFHTQAHVIHLTPSVRFFFGSLQ